MNISQYNRLAWDREVEKQNQWTVPVSSRKIAAAKKGRWKIFLTPQKPVPRAWLADIQKKQVLCLASGGGQQGPLLAAIGAKVTVFDNSPKQLQQDRMVAERDSLTLRTILGDMADLSVFANNSFDFILNPVSNVFIPKVRPVWKECYRVLKKNGVLIAGISNPAEYLVDPDSYKKSGRLEIKNRLPYSDMRDLPAKERMRREKAGIPFEFSHTLEDQIGGQIDAGFVITGFYEDCGKEGDGGLLHPYMPTYMVIRAVKNS